MLMRLVGAFLAVRGLQYLLVVLTPNHPFDTSTSLLLKELGYVSEGGIGGWNTRFWNKLLAWDSVFFIKSAVLGSATFEHEYAFSQIWSLLIRKFTHLINTRAVDELDVYDYLKAGVLLVNLLSALSCVVLYYLSLQVFNKLTRNKSKSSYQVASLTILLFILSSGSGFFITVYSEPLSFACVFLGMLARELSISIELPYKLVLPWSYWPVYTLFSSLCFGLAVANRSNCILVGFFYVFDLIQLIKRKQYQKAVFFPLAAGLILFTAFAYSQYVVPFNKFCPDRGEWCATQIVSGLPFTWQSMYTYIQSKYWNVGFLNYWTINNIPNFLFGLPQLIILAQSTIYFTRKYPIFHLEPMIWITRSFLLIMLFFAHVQVVNRVSSFIPLHLWYLADSLVKNRENQKIKHHTKCDKIAKYYIYWLMIWVPVQTFLFASFLPPA